MNSRVFVERRALVVDNGEVVQDDYVQQRKDEDGTLTVDGRVDGQPIHYQQLPQTRKQLKIKKPTSTRNTKRAKPRKRAKRTKPKKT